MILFPREGTLNTCSIHGATREKALLRKENFRTSQHIQNKRNQSALQIPSYEASNSQAQLSELQRIIVKCGCVQTWEALCGKYVYSSQQKQQKENTHQNSIPYIYIYNKQEFQHSFLGTITFETKVRPVAVFTLSEADASRIFTSLRACTLTTYNHVTQNVPTRCKTTQTTVFARF